MQVPALEALRDQIRLEMTVDGLSIQIVDASKKPLFASGKSTVLSPNMRELMRTIGKLLNEVENPISLSGHHPRDSGRKMRRTGRRPRRRGPRR